MLTPVLVLAFLLQGGVTAAPPELPRHALERECWIGRMVWFEPGSDRLLRQSQETLDWLIGQVLASGQEGHIEVEAEARILGLPFDRDLSLRRAERLRQYLLRHGFQKHDVEVRLEDEFGHRDYKDTKLEAAEEYGRMGRVTFLVRDAPEITHPGRYRHCYW